MPKPHIVIMDYRLPTLNGIEATKKILAIDPENEGDRPERGRERQGRSAQERRIRFYSQAHKP